MASARCRGLLLACLLSVCLLLPCLLLAPFAAEAQQVKLRLTSQLPSSHYAGINLAQFKEEVERRSEKTLIIEIFDNRTKEMAWVGWSTREATGQVQAEKVQEIIRAILVEFPPIPKTK